MRQLRAGGGVGEGVGANATRSGWWAGAVGRVQSRGRGAEGLRRRPRGDMAPAEGWQDILVYGLLEPRSLLDILRNFVVFAVDGGRTVRKLTGYRQLMAVKEAIRRIRTARRPRERGGVVWHTAGVGREPDHVVAGPEAAARREAAGGREWLGQVRQST